jgi:hypothetical protein
MLQNTYSLGAENQGYLLVDSQVGLRMRPQLVLPLLHTSSSQAMNENMRHHLDMALKISLYLDDEY